MAFLYRVRAVTSGWSGAPGLGTFYFGTSELSGSADTAGAQLCVDRVHAAYDDSKGLYPNTWTCQVQSEVDVITVESGAITDTLAPDAPAVVTGTSGATFGPTPVMLLMRLTTATFIAGRRLRGRAFIGPLSNAQTGGPAPESSGRTLVQAMGDALLDVGTGGPRLNVWHRPVGGAGGQAGDVITAIPGIAFSVLRSRRD